VRQCGALRWGRYVGICLAVVALFAVTSVAVKQDELVDRSLGRTTWRVPTQWTREIIDVSGQSAIDRVVLEIPWAKLHPRVRALLIGGAPLPSGLQIQLWNGDRALARLVAARASSSYAKVDSPFTGVDVWFDPTQRRVAGALGHAVGRLRDRPEIEFECDVPMPNSTTPSCALLFPYRSVSGEPITGYISAPYAWLRTTDEVVDRLLPVLRAMERR
jgi:hypothetical protein